MYDVKLISENLNITEIYNQTVSTKCGAVSLFIGTTRDNFNGLTVSKLVYEAYDEMALKMMKEVCQDIKNKWNEIENITIHHRLGEVPIGEASVVIAISSPHRQESLQAIQYAIDRLKEIVPIFKKEEYQNGNSEWKQNAECLWAKCG